MYQGLGVAALAGGALLHDVGQLAAQCVLLRHGHVELLALLRALRLELRTPAAAAAMAVVGTWAARWSGRRPQPRGRHLAAPHYRHPTFRHPQHPTMPARAGVLGLEVRDGGLCARNLLRRCRRLGVQGRNGRLQLRHPRRTLVPPARSKGRAEEESKGRTVRPRPALLLSHNAAVYLGADLLDELPLVETKQALLFLHGQQLALRLR